MTALIIIDMQNDFFRNGRLAEQRPQLTQNINQLIRHNRRRGNAVIWVRQEFLPDLSDAFLAMRQRNIHKTIAGTDGCRILAELDRLPQDEEIVKKRCSAFYQSRLDDLLQKRDVRRLILAGINTHACIRTAAIDAYQRDLEVVIVRECVDSYDTEHHDVSLRYLAGDIANVRNLSELLAEESA